MSFHGDPLCRCGSGPTGSPATILETRVVTGTGGGPEKTIFNGPRFLDPHGYRTVCVPASACRTPVSRCFSDGPKH